MGITWLWHGIGALLGALNHLIIPGGYRRQTDWAEHVGTPSIPQHDVMATELPEQGRHDGGVTPRGMLTEVELADCRSTVPAQLPHQCLDEPAENGRQRTANNWRERQRPTGIVRLSDVEPEQIEWLWPGWIPAGRIVLIDEKTDTATSTVALDIAARLSSGRPMPCAPQPTSPAGVVLITAGGDYMAGVVRPQLEAAGADLTRIVAITTVADGPVRRIPNIGDLAMIDSAIRTARASLVVIDPIAAHLSQRANGRRGQSVVDAFASLAHLALQTGAAIVIVRHPIPGTRRNSLRAEETQELATIAGSTLLVTGDPTAGSDESRVLAVLKPCANSPAAAVSFRIERSALGVDRVVWQGATRRIPCLSPVSSSADKLRSVDEAMQFITEALAEGSRPAREVVDEARQAGISQRTLDRARANLGITASRVGGAGAEGHWEWRLPSSQV
jgi:hypothetical protein